MFLGVFEGCRGLFFTHSEIKREPVSKILLRDEDSSQKMVS